MVEEIHALKNELQALQEKQEAVKAALIKKQQAAKAGMLDQIAQLAESVGLTRDEVVAHFAPANKPSKPEKINGTAKARAVWRDTVTGEKYKGGKIPGWLENRLRETGMTLHAYRQAGHMARVN